MANNNDSNLASQTPSMEAPHLLQYSKKSKKKKKKSMSSKQSRMGSGFCSTDDSGGAMGNGSTQDPFMLLDFIEESEKLELQQLYATNRRKCVQRGYEMCTELLFKKIEQRSTQWTAMCEEERNLCINKRIEKINTPGHVLTPFDFIVETASERLLIRNSRMPLISSIMNRSRANMLQRLFLAQEALATMAAEDLHSVFDVLQLASTADHATEALPAWMNDLAIVTQNC